MKLNWDTLHEGSQTLIARWAGFQPQSIVRAKWVDLDLWVRQTINDTVVRKSNGKARLM